MKTLSFCIPLFNFEEFFLKTFPINHENCLKYNSFCFSICIYGGNKKELDFLHKNYSNSKIIKIIQLNNNYFNMSDAKNIAHNNADTDFVMNCDGDNFLSVEYLESLWDVFIKNQNTDKLAIRCGGSKLRGRLGFWKKDFINLGGYDSSKNFYWPDDRDLANRAFKQKFKFITINNSKKFTLERLFNPDKKINYK